MEEIKVTKDAAINPLDLNGGRPIHMRMLAELQEHRSR